MISGSRDWTNMTKTSQSYVLTQEKKNIYDPPKDSYMNIQSTMNYNTIKLKIMPMYVNRRMDNQTTVYLYNEKDDYNILQYTKLVKTIQCVQEQCNLSLAVVYKEILPNNKNK